MLVHHISYPPISGGHVREYNLIKRLARRHEIILVCLTKNEYKEESIRHLEQFCSRVFFFPTHPISSKKLRLQLAFFSSKPWSLNVYVSEAVQEVLLSILQNEPIDLIHIQCYYLALNIPLKVDIPLLILEDNIEFLYSWRRFQVATHTVEKIMHFLNYVKEKHWEIRIWRNASACAFTSKPDKKIAEKYLPTGAAAVIPNAVDTTYYVNTSGEEALPSLAYLGNFGYLPNVDAILYFCQQIFPIILQTMAVKLYIIGEGPPEPVRVLAQHPNIIVTGHLSDTRPYLSRAWVFVCPLRIGGGTKIKMLEAMAMKKAIVSTSVGCEGLDLVPGEHVLLADNSQQFAKFIEILLKDKNLREKLGENARMLVEKKFDWDRSTDILETIYEQILKKTGINK